MHQVGQQLPASGLEGLQPVHQRIESADELPDFLRPRLGQPAPLFPAAKLIDSLLQLFQRSLQGNCQDRSH